VQNREIADSQHSLAFMYYNGEGVTQDYKEAVKWFRLGAEQGNRMAQYNLALMYENGQGVTQNYEEAVKWYRSSAEQRIAEAANNLAVMYSIGDGITQDVVYAHMWWNIAAAAGHSIAQENRDRVAKAMTSSQLAEAQRLARECVAKDYKGC
jgi:uncharacterized protein